MRVETLQERVQQRPTHHKQQTGTCTVSKTQEQKETALPPLMEEVFTKEAISVK